MTKFDLKIIPIDDRVSIIAESALGETYIQIDRKLIDNAIKESQELREEYTELINSSLSDSIREKNVEKVRKFGISLFSEIFKDEVLTLFHRTLGSSDNYQLDIRLFLGDPALSSIQWEVMRFQDEYVGFRHNLFRHPFVARPISTHKRESAKLKVLVVTVDPIYPHLYENVLKEEHRQICNLMKQLKGEVELIELEQKDATVDAIKEAFFSGVDMFHFSGHGYVDEYDPMDSSLVVYEGDDRTRPQRRTNKNPYGSISIRFLSTLAVNQGLGFSFLNACDTGKGVAFDESKEEKSQTTENPEFYGDSSKAFVNMAYNLIRFGVPVVIATNHAITYEAGSFLAKRFYTSVLKYRKRIDQALRDVRTDLYVESFHNDLLSPSDWSCPVLYSRSHDLSFGSLEQVVDIPISVQDSNDSPSENISIIPTSSESAIFVASSP